MQTDVRSLTAGFNREHLPGGRRLPLAFWTLAKGARAKKNVERALCPQVSLPGLGNSCGMVTPAELQAW
jgi:hypothetical protein